MRLLELNVFHQANLLILYTLEKDEHGGRSDIFEERVPFDPARLSPTVQSLYQRLNFQHALQENREKLEGLGLQLFDQLFGEHTRHKLRTSQATHLRLTLPEDLLYLPWELLHNGEDFLCLRYSIGRIVLRNRQVNEGRRREHPLPYRMLILSDPRDDLPHAVKEGVDLRNNLKNARDKLKLELQSGLTTHQDVMVQLRAYAMLHYAGHALGPAPGQAAGWLLEDSPLTPEDFLPMLGSPLMPDLIFANACQSATAHPSGLPSMAATFLQVGGRHYLGTVSELPDQTSGTVAQHFYTALLAGETVGESLRSAREALAATPNLPSMAWAGYVLYGAPDEVYFRSDPRPLDEPHALSPSFERRASIPPREHGSFKSTTPMGSHSGAYPPVSEPEQVPAPVSSPHPPVQGLPALADEGRSTGSESTPGSGAPEAPRIERETPPVIAPTAPAADPASASARPKLLAWLGTGILGLLMGLLAVSGIFGPLELVWESARLLAQPKGKEAPEFSTPMLLLGIEQDERDKARLLYARLLEALITGGHRPAIVAFDTWLKADHHSEHDPRLMKAVAAAIRSFPVMMAQERDPQTRALLPPPDWFIAGVQQTLTELNMNRCRLEAGILTPDAHKADPAAEDVTEDIVKGCAQTRTLTDMTERLLWSDIAIGRPPWIFEYFGLRVPLLHEVAGQPGVLQLDQPHFVLRLARPSALVLAPGQAQLRHEEQDSLTRYDQRGMIPVVFTGRASWEGGPSFPAIQLSTLLERWETKAPLPEPITQTLALLDGERLRILVGTASPQARGNEMDRYNTPLGWMFGVEVLANAAEALAAGTVPRPLPAPLWPVLGLLSAWMGLRLKHWQRAFRGRGAGVALKAPILLLSGIGLIALSYVLLGFGWSMPPIAPLLALILGGLVGSKGSTAATTS